MRLLNVNNYHYRRGGSDVLYMEHASMFESMGHEIAYFSMHHPKNEDTPWSRTFVNEIEFGHEYGSFAQLIMATKVVYSFEARRQIGDVISEFKPDIAHLHCIYHHLSPSILDALRSAKIPIVMTAHDLKLACPAYKMLNRSGICELCRQGSVLNVVKNRCIRDSFLASAVVAVESGLQRWLQTYQKSLDAIVVPSRFFLDKFVEWGWSRDRFTYIPNYVDADRFAPQYRPGRYFIYFGRLAPEKGLKTLIKAAAATGYEMTFVGTGPEEASLRALVAELGAPVKFSGYQSGEELHALIRGARAVVLPSEWYENAPLSVLESMALGKTVIGARIGGIPELILEDHTGWLFKSGDVQDLSAVLDRVYAMSDEKISECGKQSRVQVLEKYSRECYIEAMSRLYQTLGVDVSLQN